MKKNKVCSVVWSLFERILSLENFCNFICEGQTVSNIPLSDSSVGKTLD